jgi:hypothetical protein
MKNIESVSLIDKAQIAALLPDAEVGFERIAGLPKSLIAVRRR